MTTERRLGVGWIIIGGAAILIMVLAVNGTLQQKFHAAWHWMSTVGGTSSTAAPGDQQSTISRIIHNPTIGPAWSPVNNPIGMWYQIIAHVRREG
jgi:hypothetical protein